MPKIIDIKYIWVTDELMEKPLMCLENEIQKFLDMGFKLKWDVIVKADRWGTNYYIQHLVKYDSK